MASVMIVPQGAVPHDLKAQIVALLNDAWPSELTLEEQLRRPLHDPDRLPLAVILIESGIVLGYLAIPFTTISHSDRAYRAAGLSAVVTHPEQRRRGHGQRLVAAARDTIAASDADIGIFTCDLPLVPFYARCGWTPMPNTAVIGGTRTRPFPAAPLGKRTMMGFFSERALDHRRDFEGAALYLELREGDLW